MSATIVTLKPQSDGFAHRRHPWVFSGAIGGLTGDPVSGDTVDVRTAHGVPLGLGAWSPRSQIAVRMWTFDPAEAVDEAFFRRRLEQALQLRERLRPGLNSNACRLVNAEADGLPGLIVDRYADVVVCAFLSAGAERWKPVVVRLLQDLAAPAGIYERSDAEVRSKEGLEPVTGPLAGAEPPAQVAINEGPLRYQVDVRNGHKTGFYLDQRDNRRTVAACAAGEVLNAFAYTGAFGIAALHGGARHVTQLDSSAAALDAARLHAELNGIAAERVAYVQGDAFVELRHFRDSRRQFDTIVLDPPRFAASRHQLEGACRGYKDINLLAFKLLRPGGILATFSCSALMDPALFQQVVAAAAIDAGRDVQILRWLSQASDHPVALCAPEGHYLKGLLCRTA